PSKSRRRTCKIRLPSVRISLGFSQAGELDLTEGKRILQVRLRDFEGPACGAFYVVEYMPELEHFYEIGKEIVCYESKEDLAGKIKYYLEHEDEREAIRKAGYERAVKDHTWQKRFADVFRQAGIA
nr:glycosyltransferase [bacterium]